MSKSKCFCVYYDCEKIVNQLSNEDRGKLFSMLIAYGDRGELPKVDKGSPISLVFTMFQQTIDRDQEKYNRKCEVNRANASKGGQKKTETKQPQANVTERKQPQPSTLVKTTKEALEDKHTAEIQEIIDYLNLKAGTNYRASTQINKRHIMERLNENFSVDDCKKVIDNQCSEWLKTEYAKYLRPETLFGSKFESYLNTPKKERKASYDIELLARIE